MRIVVTGTLKGMTQEEAYDHIRAIGCEPWDRVTYDTDYLVATTLNSTKARRAAEIGVTVITQGEFEEFLAEKGFPVTPGAVRPRPSFPQIPWEPLPADQQPEMGITYHDSDGVVTDRRIRVTATGSLTSATGLVREFVKAIELEIGAVRTFRKDRILEVRD